MTQVPKQIDRMAMIVVSPRKTEDETLIMYSRDEI